MGGVVLYRNSGKLSHRIFALLTLNLSLWALGVLVIIHCHTPDAARLWIKVTLMIAGFLPATFYHFCGCFPSHRFLGSRAVLAGLIPQFLLLPVGTWLATLVLDLPPNVEAAMILVAACPGGSLSNYLTHFGRGNTALS